MTAMQNGDAASSQHVIPEQPLGTKRQVRIITVGAGATGLNFIRTLRLHLTDYTHAVYETNPQVGGTWYENRYPGCRCDIPSHNYQFSWKQNPEWTSFFSPAEEIGAYLCKICEDEGLGSEIRLRHKVVSAIWNDEEGIWKVTVANLETGEEFEDSCQILVNAGGILK